jgi:hypothetical protein
VAELRWTPDQVPGGIVTASVRVDGAWVEVEEADAATGAMVLPLDVVPDGCVSLDLIDDAHETGQATIVCLGGGVTPSPTTLEDPAGLTAGDLSAPVQGTDPDEPVIEAFNLTPSASSSAMGMAAGMAHTRSVAPLASDPDGDLLTYELMSTGFDRSGFKFSWNSATGSFTMTVPPCTGGASSLTFRVRDQFGAVSGTATVLLDFVNKNRAPVASGGAMGLRAGKTHTRTVAPLASDPDGDELTFELMSTGFDRSGFKFSWKPSTGSFTMTVPVNSGGMSYLKYRAVDRCGAVSATATVSLDFVI